MDWVVAGSAFTGTVIAFLLILGVFLIWIYFDDRKRAEIEAKAELERTARPKTFQDDVLERHLEELVVGNFQWLFPGWQIYENQTIDNDGAKQSGIRYRTPAGEIDLLCLDNENNLVVIELKRNRAPDRVVSQLDRYIAWVEQNIAEPGQKVRGIIIAKKHGDHVIYSALRRNDIELWTYDLKLTLVPKSATTSITRSV